MNIIKNLINNDNIKLLTFKLTPESKDILRKEN